MFAGLLLKLAPAAAVAGCPAMASVYRILDPLDRLRIRIRIRQLQDGNATAAANTEEARKKSAVNRIFAYTLRWQERLEGPRDVVAGSKRDADKVARVRDHAAARSHVLFTYTAADGFSPVDGYGTPLLKDSMGVAAPTLMSPLAASRASRKLKHAAGYRESASRKKIEKRDRRDDGLGTPMYVMLATDLDADAFAELAKPREDRTRDLEAEARLCQEHALCQLRVHDGGRLEMTPGFSRKDPQYVDVPPAWASDDRDPDAELPPPDADDSAGTGPPLLTNRVATPSGHVFEYVIENASRCDDVDELSKILRAELERERKIIETREDRYPDCEADPRLPLRGTFGLNIAMQIKCLVGFEPDWLYCEYEIYLPRGWTAEKQDGDPYAGDWSPSSDGELMYAGCSQLAQCKERPMRASFGSHRSMNDVAVAKEVVEPDPEEYGVLAFVVGLFIFGVFVGPAYIAWLLFGICVTFCAYGVSPAAGTSPHAKIEHVAHVALPLDMYLVAPESDHDVDWATLEGDDDDDAPAPAKKKPTREELALKRKVLSDLRGGGVEESKGDEAKKDDETKDESKDDEEKEEDTEEDAGPKEKPPFRPPRSSRRVPRLYVSVSARRSFERYTVEGYGHCRLPGRTGTYRERLVTWKPVGRVRDMIQDFFLGGAHRLADLRYAAHPPDEWHAHPDQRYAESSFLSKFGFMTERSGAVDVEFSVVEVRPRSKKVKLNALTPSEDRAERLKSRSASARARLNRLDAILADYRSKLKVGSDYTADDFDKNKGRSAAQRAAELIRKLEDERASAKVDRPHEMGSTTRARPAPTPRSTTRNPLADGARVVEPKPKGDTVLDFSKTFTVGGVEVTKPDGERVIDFSRGAAPLDILTGDAAASAPDETGVAESKKDDPPKGDDASR